MTGTALDPAHCPLCGEANDCAMVDGRPTCWCFEEQIPAEVLERVPAAAQGVVCVCKGCATKRGSPQERLDQIHELLRRR